MRVRLDTVGLTRFWFSTPSSAPNVDIEIRWCLLKLCEVLIKPSEEPLPKIKLRMPVRLPSSAAPGNKAGSPEVPLSASTGIPKIKFGGQEVLRRDSLLDSPGAGPLKLVLGNKKGQASSANGPKLLREQKGGMSMSDLKVSQNLMQKLAATKKADLFRRPVGECCGGMLFLHCRSVD